MFSLWTFEKKFEQTEREEKEEGREGGVSRRGVEKETLEEN